MWQLKNVFGLVVMLAALSSQAWTAHAEEPVIGEMHPSPYLKASGGVNETKYDGSPDRMDISVQVDSLVDIPTKRFSPPKLTGVPVSYEFLGGVFALVLLLLIELDRHRCRYIR